MTDISSGRAAPALFLRERFAIIAALVGVTAISWLYLWQLARDMDEMAGAGHMAGMMMSAGPTAWTGGHFALMLAMWWVMMVGMMLPSAMPIILIFATVYRRKRTQGKPYVPTAVFTAGYLLAWGAFSLAATLAQWWLELAALMTPMMRTSSTILGGMLFLAAGFYQFTPAKYACLDKCRSPLDFVLNNWREGRVGALAVGLRYGFFCLGCCWAVMLLMFVGGAMNLLWAAVMAVFVLVEKLAPWEQWVARVSGGAMIAFGAYLLTQI